MKNAIYQGRVIHHRLSPKVHYFNYRVNYFFFALDDHKNIPTLPLLLSFNPKNYLNDTRIREEIGAKFGEDARASIRKIYILTQLSYLGFCFNPVSFYYCYGESGELLFILSQITNTPWGEKHIDCFDYRGCSGEITFPKDFHVSPFMPMEINYVWKFNIPRESIQILMTNHLQAKNEKIFFAQMHLTRKEFSALNAWISFFSYPMMSFKTIAGIYWQALILFIKQVPFYTHPKKREIL